MSSYYNHSAKDVLMTIEKKEKAEEPERFRKQVPLTKTIKK